MIDCVVPLPMFQVKVHVRYIHEAINTACLCGEATLPNRS